MPISTVALSTKLDVVFHVVVPCVYDSGDRLDRRSCFDSSCWCNLEEYHSGALVECISTVRAGYMRPKSLPLLASIPSAALGMATFHAEIPYDVPTSRFMHIIRWFMKLED